MSLLSSPVEMDGAGESPEEIAARGCRDAAIHTHSFHEDLKEKSAHDFLCRFAESARGFTAEQIVRIGDVADSGQPGALSALAKELGRSLLDVVAIVRDFGNADERTP